MNHSQQQLQHPPQYLRRLVVRQCKARGWTIQPEALHGLVQVLEQSSTVAESSMELDVDGMLNTLLDSLAHSVMAPPDRSTLAKTTTSSTSAMVVVTDELWEQWMMQQIRDDDDAEYDGGTGAAAAAAAAAAMASKKKTNRSTATASSKHYNITAVADDFCASPFAVVSAFDTPKLVFEPLRKRFALFDPTMNDNNVNSDNKNPKNHRKSLFGTAEDKANMLSQRYALIHQRLLRHERFQRPQQHHANHDHDPSSHSKPPEPYYQITPIESLLGTNHRRVVSDENDDDHHRNSVLLLGLLMQIEQGVWYVEDPTGQVPVDLSALLRRPNNENDTLNTNDEDFFVTEHSILLVVGAFRGDVDGVFQVSELAQPFLEPRDISLRAIRKHVSHPALALPEAASSASSSSSSTPSPSPSLSSSFRAHQLVVLSDVHLDQPRILSQLEGLLARYEPLPPTQLPTFVFMGNFSASAMKMPSSTSITRPTTATATAQLRNHRRTNGVAGMLMEELAALILLFPNLQKHAAFVLIPGPNDPVSWGGIGGKNGGVLPMSQPPLFLSLQKAKASSTSSSISTLWKRIPHATFATNPCRLRFHDHEHRSSSSCCPPPAANHHLHHHHNADIVLFRYDLLHLLQSQQLLPLRFHHNHANLNPNPNHPSHDTKHKKNDSEDNRDDNSDQEDKEEVVNENTPPSSTSTCTSPIIPMHRRLIKTILCQGHLCPVSLGVVPIVWNYDHALRVYPLPTLLILGGDPMHPHHQQHHPYPFHEWYDGCHVVHPGSMSSSSSSSSSSNNNNNNNSSRNRNSSSSSISGLGGSHRRRKGESGRGSSATEYQNNKGITTRLGGGGGASFAIIDVPLSSLSAEAAAGAADDNDDDPNVSTCAAAVVKAETYGVSFGTLG